MEVSALQSCRIERPAPLTLAFTLPSSLSCSPVGTAWYGRGGPNVDEELVKAVLMALDAGFRSLDCAVRLVSPAVLCPDKLNPNPSRAGGLR